MFDSNVQFTDVDAETIAMEDVVFTDVDADTLAMRHFDELRDELNMDSTWSIWDGGCMSADKMLLGNKQYRVVYTFVRPGSTQDDLWADLMDSGKRTEAEVSAFAASGSVQDLWEAANSCIKQSGTHHHYIENFELQDDGTLSLETGS